jgi:hypothetical protein
MQRIENSGQLKSGCAAVFVLAIGASVNKRTGVVGARAPNS